METIIFMNLLMEKSGIRLHIQMQFLSEKRRDALFVYILAADER